MMAKSKVRRRALITAKLYSGARAQENLMARLPLDGKHRENALLGSSLLYAGMRSFDFAGTSLREVSAALKMTEMGAAYARLV